MASISITFDWQPAGDIVLADGLRFPRLTDVPGLYRFNVGDEVYIGETDRLRRRMNGYRNPGPSQWTNIRINTWLVEALGSGHQCQLVIVVEGFVVLDGDSRLLRFKDKADRVLAEREALRMEVSAGRRLRNLLGRGGR